jgi:hypothetical protein
MKIPHLKQLHGTYTKTPTNKADVMALNYASTFTPITHSNVTQFTISMHETLTTSSSSLLSALLASMA